MTTPYDYLTVIAAGYLVIHPGGYLFAGLIKTLGHFVRKK